MVVVTETVVLDGREIIVTPEGKVIYEILKEILQQLKRANTK